MDVEGVPVADLRTSDVISEAALPAVDRARLIFALHVGGLEPLRGDDFRQALGGADLLYADGSAVVFLARLGGARAVTRSATTDIGIPIIRELGKNLGRVPRVALVGGNPPTTVLAGESVASQVECEVVLAEGGYFTESRPVLEGIGKVKPDIVLVGLGMPKEAVWTYEHRDALPPAIILTCGGWFGFLAGDEPRAPRALRHVGMEWSFRLANDFVRLRRRYAVGAWLTLKAVPRQLRKRVSESERGQSRR